MKIERHRTGYLAGDAPLEIEGYQDNYYCAVVISARTGHEILGRGTARRSPQDKDRPEIAQQLALGRALESASHRVLKSAAGLVKHQDDMRAEKLRLKNKRELTKVAAPEQTKRPLRRTRKSK